MNHELKPKQLTDLLEISPSLLRKWEKGLKLDIPRNPMGHRIFNPAWVDYFKMVKELIEKDYSLEQISSHIDTPGQRKKVVIEVSEAELEFVY